jgi:ParB-like chromosome segregation protein Spo0J
MKVQKILLSRIDTESEGWDQFILDPKPVNVDRLATSLQRVGQIYPLVLRKDMDWLFIICGYARYLALNKLEIEEAWARIYQKNELSDEQALWMALEEDCALPYPPEKQKLILSKFRGLGYKEKDLAERVAPAIELDPTIDAVRKTLGL